MPLRFDPGGHDHDAFEQTRDALLAEFEEWLGGRQDPDDGETVSDAQIFIDWRYNYSTGVLDEYRDGDITEFLLEWCPRKLVVAADSAFGICRSVGAFIEFLARTGRLAGGAGRAARLITVADELGPQMCVAMSDPANFGMGKALFAGGSGAVPELPASMDDLQAVLQARMNAHNALPFEERRALTDRFFEPEPKKIELPFVHIPAPFAEVESAAAAAPLVRKVEALREYLADGKPLTDKGHLKLADGRALIELLDTGDQMDQLIGDRTFKTQSTDTMRGLVFIVDVAKEAGAVRVYRRRLVPVAAWSSRTLVEQSAALYRAVLTAGPLWSRSRRSIPLFDRLDELLDDGIVHWLAAMLAPDSELPFEQIVDWAQSAVDSAITPYLTDQGRHEWIERSVSRGVGRIFDTLAMAGVVEWNEREQATDGWGFSEPHGGTFALTALGRHVVPDDLPDAGYVLRRVEDLTHADATALIEALTWVPEDHRQELADSWQPDRSPAERAEMLVTAIASVDDSTTRLAGFVALDCLDPLAVGPLARQLLDSPAAGHAALWLLAHGLADEETVGAFVNVGVLIDVLATTLDDPPELCHLFAGMSQPGQAELVLGDMWRHPAPETAAVLDALGAHLPDRQLAKLARKAAIKHRSWMANRA
jgi:hypothetical protein